jgi:peptidoglycan hydrolase CwlO-like protein
MFKKLLFFSLFLITVLNVFFKPSIVLGQSVDELQEKISQYAQKLNELGTAKNTLNNQIQYLDSQYQLTLLKITQTENSISALEKEISNLSVEIGKLEKQIDQLSATYINQIIQSYKLQKKYPVFAYLFFDNLNTFLEQHQYASSIQSNSKQNLINMETVRYDYDKQKTTKEEKQAELETLQKTLASQKSSLTGQKITKNNLLESTKNDEKKYQQLLAEAQSQLASFRSFSSGAGGSICLDSVPGGGSDGNFYSQRDPRWCKQYIGNSSDTIGSVGCFISSISMVYKKLGNDITPSAYAANSSNFWGNTAYMSIPAPPGGYSYKQVAYNSGTIDSELNAGRYVIAQVKMSNISGMHFIVIISGSNGNYKIHDPWFGADQNFADRYSPALVMSLRLITK